VGTAVLGNGGRNVDVHALSTPASERRRIRDVEFGSAPDDDLADRVEFDRPTTEQRVRTGSATL
jgi:hypothetical protein